MIHPDFWKDKRVFVTGHTGFKGSWLCMWLTHLGAKVFGYALEPPTSPSLYQIAGLNDLVDSTTADVADRAALEAVLATSQAEIVVHMAAQTLVRYSYANPIETFATNVMGSVHLLDAARRVPTVRAIVMVTSDKCYQNHEWVWGYREDSQLGGVDPYSASKACAEIAVAAMRSSYFTNDGEAPLVASARAGNVIGGGDWALDRLVPDVIRSLLAGEPTQIRNPQATRPWQHVLEPLHGYLILAERLYAGGREFAEAWNFGPPEESEKTVGWIIDRLYKLWDAQFDWVRDSDIGPPESTFLKLDASKARAYLGWRPKLDLPTTLEWIIEWTRRYQAGEGMLDTSLADIERYMAISASD
jgi:CDP-glucose 4,6-dehydratase